jgi:NADH-quinone oxidoreductase subunit L
VEVVFTFSVDALSLPMAALVLIVSLVTQLFSAFYMAEEPNLIRFWAYLNLFTFSMLCLVFATNFPLFFLGWEGVGLCSYLLIGFWSSRPEARFAALKAVTFNRVGDSALLAAVGLLLTLCGSLDFGMIFLVAPLMSSVTLPSIPGALSLLTLAN